MKNSYKLEDINSVALLLRYKTINSKMISAERVIEFNRLFEKRIQEIETKDIFNDSFGYSELLPELIYFNAFDEVGKEYLVLKDNLDLELELERFHISTIIDNMIDDELLKTINLIMVDGNIVSRSEHYQFLAYKYHLKHDTSIVRSVFNIFNDWENIANEGLIQNFCLSEEEKLILEELRKNKEKQGKNLIKTNRAK